MGYVVVGFLIGVLLGIAFYLAWTLLIAPRLRLRRLERAPRRSAAEDWELARLQRPKH